VPVAAEKINDAAKRSTSRCPSAQDALNDPAMRLAKRIAATRGRLKRERRKIHTPTTAIAKDPSANRATGDKLSVSVGHGKHLPGDL